MAMCYDENGQVGMGVAEYLMVICALTLNVMFRNLLLDVVESAGGGGDRM